MIVNNAFDAGLAISPEHVVGFILYFIFNFFVEELRFRVGDGVGLVATAFD